MSKNKLIPVNQPVISDAAKKYVNEALDGGWLSSAGPFVDKFERAFAEYIGVGHAVAVCNGTAALHAALLAAGIGEGDEVIVPAFTMIASIFSILYTGAKPVFVDCELHTFNLDVTQLESKVTPKTKAIMPVHLFGHACEMDAVTAVARKHGLVVLEDAAEAHGGEYRGKRCGALGDLACFSFYANKIITTGEGGMIVTSDGELAARARRFRDLCHSPARRFIHDEVGYNFRMTNLQAAVGLGELGSIDRYLARKIAMAARYTERLAGVPGIRAPITRPHVKNVYWMYTILVDEAAFGMTKDGLRAQLRERGIDTRDVFYPPNEQPALVERLGELGSFPNTERAARTGCYLPSGLAITDEEIDEVAAVVRELAKS